MRKLVLTTYTIATLGVAQAFGLQVTMGTFVNGSGGNYTANPSTDFEYILSNYGEQAKEGTDLSNTVFGTFCLEKKEYFNPGHTYDIALNDRAINGGIDNHENPFEANSDVISRGTALLYQAFATGSLGGATPYSSSWASDLQNMIWFLEDEQSAPTGITNWDYFSGLLTAEFGTLDIAQANNDVGGYGVGVMNLSQRNSTGGIIRKQDQLVYLGVPDGGTTLALLGLGLAGLATIGRRFFV